MKNQCTKTQRNRCKPLRRRARKCNIKSNRIGAFVMDLQINPSELKQTHSTTPPNSEGFEKRYASVSKYCHKVPLSATKFHNKNFLHRFIHRKIS